MYRTALGLLLAVGPEQVAPLSPVWLPAHALRWLRDALHGLPVGDHDRPDAGLRAWTSSLTFRTDLQAGLTVPGLREALTRMMTDGTLRPVDAGWRLGPKRLLALRGAVASLDPAVADALRTTASRWQDAGHRVARPADGPVGDRSRTS